MARTVDTFGASVRGPRNRREGRANQDAWARASGPFGDLIVVCDGMGSRPNSSVGARAACAAAKKAVRLWPGTASSADPRLLVRLVEILWRLELTPRMASDCATTCAMALREPDGNILIAGLGDGLAVIKWADGSLSTLGGRDAGAFGDETLALGTTHEIDDWWIGVEPPGSGRTVVLATDGVADDIDSSRLAGFVDWLADDIGPIEAATRWRRLRRELQDWPVPHHVDDKTIAILREGAGGQP
ncbi:MAG: protein phosphatase 2C domain-containing protein [Deltaproteobacteria bacterium]|nr:MAG: protein phosphatase 2C domain-containing protein [Deltaproteobacteria bacterium]